MTVPRGDKHMMIIGDQEILSVLPPSTRNKKTPRGTQPLKHPSNVFKNYSSTKSFNMSNAGRTDIGISAHNALNTHLSAVSTISKAKKRGFQHPINASKRNNRYK